MNDLKVWEQESESKTKFLELGILDIAKKISREFRPNIESYLGNYWDCGWSRSMEILDATEQKDFEKALSKIGCSKYEVPYLYKGELFSTFGQETKIFSINRYTGTFCLERYDKDMKLLDMHLSTIDDKSSISRFFSSLRLCDKKFSPAIDTYHKHTFYYPSGKEKTEIGMIHYFGESITSLDLAREAGVIKD